MGLSYGVHRMRVWILVERINSLVMLQCYILPRVPRGKDVFEILINTYTLLDSHEDVFEILINICTLFGSHIWSINSHTIKILTLVYPLVAASSLWLNDPWPQELLSGMGPYFQSHMKMNKFKRKMANKGKKKTLRNE